MRAQSSSYRTPSSGPVEEELHAIRRELAKLQEEIAAGQGSESNSSDSERGGGNDEGYAGDDFDGANRMGGAYRSGSASTDVSVDGGSAAQLRAVLERSVARLERERRQRKQLEKELADLRQDRLRETSQVIDGLERKREELSKITKERNELREWLDRAVRECRRVADEVVRLRTELDINEQRREKLETQVQQSRLHVQQLNAELEAEQKKLSNALERGSLLETCANEHCSSVERAENSRRQRQQDCEVLAQKVGELEERLRGQQQAEGHLQLLTECMRQLQRHIEDLSNIVRTDKWDDERVTSELPSQYNPGAIAVHADMPIEVIVDEAKELLRSLVASVRSLQCDIVRFAVSRNTRMEAHRAARDVEVAALHLEKQAHQYRYSVEREALEELIEKLNMEIKQLIGDATEREITVHQELRGSAQKAEELEALLQRNEELSDQNSALRQKNEEMRNKLRRFKVDWTKVHESQQRLQQLQLEVHMMNENANALSRENENLKIFLSTVSPHTGGPLAASTAFIAGGTSATSNNSNMFTVANARGGSMSATPALASPITIPAFASPSMARTENGSQIPQNLPGMYDASAMLDSTSPSAVPVANQPMNTVQKTRAGASDREAFKEWKRTILTEYQV